MDDELKNYQTDEWKLYEKGKTYNISKGLYEETEKNYDFYHGKQWNNVQLGSIKPITLNIIKSIVKTKLGVLNSNLYQIVFTPNYYATHEEQQQLEETCKTLNKYSNRMWENEQIIRKLREVLKDSCINSEGILHSYEEKGNIKFEIIDKNNIYYGNENDSEIQSQPYILITYRRPVDEVKEKAKANGTNSEAIAMIVPDSDYEEQAGRENRRDEITPMCLVIRKYFMQNGTVWFKESTRTTVITEEQDTKLESYPIAHMVWEEEKGSARGIGEVKHLIPNQIEINKTATRRLIAVQMCAYPKLVANMKYVTNPSSLEKVGSTIKVNEMGADDVSKVVNYLRPTSMSGDATNLQLELMNSTRELAGAGDSASGNVDPTQASGTAILAVQRTAQQPLNEQQEKFKTFIENVARIWFEMLKNYSTDGIIATKEDRDPVSGDVTEQQYNISYNELQKMKFNIKIEITPKSSFDKFAQEQSLENLLRGQFITFEEYVQALDIDSDMPKAKLEKILEDRKVANEKITEMQMEAERLNSAMNQVMSSESQNEPQYQGGMNNEMSGLQVSGNAG